MYGIGGRVVLGTLLTRVELAGALACALSFTGWEAMALGRLNLAGAVFFLVLCVACPLAGRVFARVLGPAASNDFPTTFLLGFFLLNSALFVLALVSPLSITVNALIVLAAVVLAQAYRPSPGDPAGVRGQGVALMTLGVTLAAATLWSQDSITPEVVASHGVLLKPWSDSYFHTCEIRLFRDARGCWSLEDLRMAGQPAWIYHHASYLVPALLAAVSGVSPYMAFASFQVPSGIVLTGLAAYVLIRSLWGGRAGLAAVVALLLVPDATQHGVKNLTLGYHWLQQIAPGGAYGVALLAVAWMLMFEGCRAGRHSLVVLSFLAAGMVVNFKAHMFVASALLLWLYPGVFFRGAGRWGKGLWLAFALSTFILATRATERIEAIPTLRLDGSSLRHYVLDVAQRLDHAPDREFFLERVDRSVPCWRAALWGSILLFYGTLGLFGVANVVLAVAAQLRPAWRRDPSLRLELRVFPLLVSANYLVMSLGLAYDAKNPYHPNELQHRPLVWAYFVAAIWAGGLAYRLFLERAVVRYPWLRAVLLAAVVLLLRTPLRYGHDIQVGPPWGRALTNRTYPRGWYECARYLRAAAEPGEIVQDSQNDPLLLFSALCERPSYAIAYYEGGANDLVKRRVEELKEFKNLTSEELIEQFAAGRHIRWFVLHPRTRIAWPESLLARPEFTWAGFRVYEFGRRPHPWLKQPEMTRRGERSEPRAPARQPAS
jgi:hypothetical protein